MKGESDVVAHVVAATGVGEAEVRRVVEAAFGFLRASALAGEEVVHPSLGTIRPRQRASDGKTVFRFLPEGPAGGAKAGGGRKAGGGGERAGGGAGRRPGKGRAGGGRGA